MEATVAKLAKTADDVSVVPNVDNVWHPEFGECYLITTGKARPAATEHLLVKPVLVSDCYSTREAAEAAKGGGGKRDPYLQGIMKGLKGEDDG